MIIIKLAILRISTTTIIILKIMFALSRGNSEPKSFVQINME